MRRSTMDLAAAGPDEGGRVGEVVREGSTAPRLGEVNPGQRIAGSARDLQERLDEHCLLLSATFAVTPGVEPPCVRLRRLRLVMAEAVEVIESTRGAFKSRRLEELRKRLIRALAECE